METLQKYIETLDQTKRPQIITISYTYQGVRINRKGFAITMLTEFGNREEVLTFEPKHYANGDRWLISGSLLKISNTSSFYAKNIKQAINIIKS